MSLENRLQRLEQQVHSVEDDDADLYEQFQTRCDDYLRDVLNITPWRGANNSVGQLELCGIINESVKEQLNGSGKPLKLRVVSANGVGKTYLSSALANWFYDAFRPSVTIVNAPNDDQINLLFWPSLRKHRKHDKGELYPSAPIMAASRGNKKPGDELHVVYGRVARDEASAKGQHHEFQMFIFEEAEGVPDHYYEAVTQMLTGCKVGIWLLIGNPGTRSSRFYQCSKDPTFTNIRFDLFNYPNVVNGTNDIPGGTTRQWLEAQLVDRSDPCPIVSEHNEEKYTFELPWRPGVIYQASPSFLRRCRGITPKEGVGNTFISEAVYEAAKTREVSGQGVTLQVGFDASRYGDDFSKVYSLSDFVCRLEASIGYSGQDNFDRLCANAIIAAVKGRYRPHHRRISIRVDGTGGFSSGVVALCKEDSYLQSLSAVIHEVHFSSDAHDKSTYRYIITELYAEMAETLKGIRLENPPTHLESDLLDRTFDHVNISGVTLKRLQEKEKFKKEHHNRSPDDGDGAVLACAPEYLFQEQGFIPPMSVMLAAAQVRVKS